MGPNHVQSHNIEVLQGAISMGWFWASAVGNTGKKNWNIKYATL